MNRREKWKLRDLGWLIARIGIGTKIEKKGHNPKSDTFGNR